MIKRLRFLWLTSDIVQSEVILEDEVRSSGSVSGLDGMKEGIDPPSIMDFIIINYTPK